MYVREVMSIQVEEEALVDLVALVGLEEEVEGEREECLVVDSEHLEDSVTLEIWGMMISPI